MIKNIISLVLLLVSAGLSFSHGWGSFNYKKNPESFKMMSELGLAEWTMPVFGVLAILVGILLLLPRTFFIAICSMPYRFCSLWLWLCVPETYE